MKTLIFPLYNQTSHVAHDRLLVLPFDRPQAREMFDRSKRALERWDRDRSFSHEAFRVPNTCAIHEDDLSKELREKDRFFVHYKYDVFLADLDDEFYKSSRNSEAKPVFVTYNYTGNMRVSCELGLGTGWLAYDSRWLCRESIGEIAMQLGEA